MIYWRRPPTDPRRRREEEDMLEEISKVSIIHHVAIVLAFLAFISTLEWHRLFNPVIYLLCFFYLFLVSTSFIGLFFLFLFRVPEFLGRSFLLLPKDTPALYYQITSETGIQGQQAGCSEKTSFWFWICSMAESCCCHCLAHLYGKHCVSEIPFAYHPMVSGEVQTMDGRMSSPPLSFFLSRFSS